VSNWWDNGNKQIAFCGKGKQFIAFNDQYNTDLSVNLQVNMAKKSTIQINQPTRCNSFTSLLLDVYVWFNMLRAPLWPLSGAHNCLRSLWFYRWKVAVGDPTLKRVAVGDPTYKRVAVGDPTYKRVAVGDQTATLQR
jgi:hypothetical protein